jgi:hypothetical protein
MMTTAGPATQTSKPVIIQDVQHYSLGQRTDKAGPLAVVPGLGNVTVGFVIIPGPIQFPEIRQPITGFQLTTDTPAVVLVQPRQAANQDFAFPDEFAVMVNVTSRTELLVTIKREDVNGGWGQDLRLDIFIIDS